MANQNKQFESFMRTATAEEGELIQSTFGEFEKLIRGRLYKYIFHTAIAAFATAMLILALTPAVAAWIPPVLWIFWGAMFAYTMCDAFLVITQQKEALKFVKDGEYKVVTGKAHDCEVMRYGYAVFEGYAGENQDFRVQCGINADFVEADNFDRRFLCFSTKNGAFVVAKMPNGDVLISNDVDFYEKEVEV